VQLSELAAIVHWRADLEGASLPAVGGLALDGPGVPQDQAVRLLVGGVGVPDLHQLPPVLGPHPQDHVPLLVGGLGGERNQKEGGKKSEEEERMRTHTLR
jgi:hypothetical protein